MVPTLLANVVNNVGHQCCTVCAYPRHVGDSKKFGSLARFEHIQKCWPTFEVIALENLFLSKGSLKKLFTNKTVNKHGEKI